DNFLKKRKLANKTIRNAITLIEGLKLRVKNDELDAWEIFKLGKEFALEIENLLQHLKMQSKHEEVRIIYDKLPIHDKDELAITGYDLMQETNEKPGPWMSNALEAALKAVIYGEVKNEVKSIIRWLNKESKIPYFNDEE